MLHTATAQWNPATEGFGGLGANASLAAVLASGEAPMAVSASQPLALVEQREAASAPAAAPPVAPGSDTAVMALALIGAWMMLLGAALLARHWRFESYADSARQHQ